MRSEELLDSLCRDLAPVTPSKTPALNVATWVTWAVVTAGFFLAGMLRPRADLSAALVSGPFICRALALMSVAVLGAWELFAAAIPGNLVPASRRDLRGFFMIAAFVAVILPDLVFGKWNLRGELTSPGFSCAAAFFIFGFLPATILTLKLRRLALTDPKSASWIVGLTAGAFATVSLSFHCAVDTATHVLIWHTLPVFALAFGGMLALPKLFRW